MHDLVPLPMHLAVALHLLSYFFDKLEHFSHWPAQNHPLGCPGCVPGVLWPCLCLGEAPGAPGQLWEGIGKCRWGDPAPASTSHCTAPSATITVMLLPTVLACKFSGSFCQPVPALHRPPVPAWPGHPHPPPPPPPFPELQLPFHVPPEVCGGRIWGTQPGAAFPAPFPPFPSSLGRGGMLGAGEGTALCQALALCGIPGGCPGLPVGSEAPALPSQGVWGAFISTSLLLSLPSRWCLSHCTVAVTIRRRTNPVKCKLSNL